MDKDFYKLCQQKNDCLQAQYETERKYIYNKYNQEFTVLEGFFDFCIELGKVLDSYIPEPEKPFLQFALLRIHERALKISREAKIMMENGSASGAIARWRTLFEFSVVANILIKYPDLAQKYIDYAAVDDYKFARRLVEYQDRLNLFHYDLSALDDVVIGDYTEFHMEETHDDLYGGYAVLVDKFLSDRVMQKIFEFNEKARMSATEKKPFKPIEISEEGLELIEYLSVDCTAADGEWHSDSEVKIDKLGYVVRNGTKTKEFWDGTVRSDKRPLRLKIRNICGDETEWEVY